MSCAPCQRVNIVSGANGHCCNECAEASAIRKMRHIALYAPRSVRHAVRMEVGAIGEHARPWTDADKLESDTRQFEQEVKDALHRWGDKLTDVQTAFVQELTHFLAEQWRPWYQHGKESRQELTVKGALTFQAMLKEEVRQFDGMEADFAAFVRRWKDSLHEETSVEPPDGKSPLESALSFPIPKWVVPVALAVGAILLLGPALGPVLGSVFAAKAVATGAKVATGVVL